MEYLLYNFDHKLNNEKQFTIEDYKIVIDKKHVDNCNNLKKAQTIIFNHDKNGNRIITKNEEQAGGFFVTAKLKVSSECIKPSILYKGDDNRSSVDDFLVILSYLSGRRVYIERDVDASKPLYYKDSVVNSNFYNFPIMDFSNGLKKIESLKLETAFLNLACAKEAYEFPATCFYVTTVIDAISTKWASKNGYSQYPNKINIKCIRRKAAHFISKGLVNKANIEIIRLIKEEAKSNTIANDIVSRVNIHNSPSALFKLQKFLSYLDVFPGAPSEVELKRLKYLNQARNSIIHSGDILNLPDKDYDTNINITIGITMILLLISNVYFATKIFKINNSSIEDDIEVIKKYFSNGEFRNMKIFEESYAKFTDRQEQDWLNTGNII